MRCLSLLILIYDAIADETFVPRTLVETDDIPLNGEDSTDAGAALVKSGAYAGSAKQHKRPALHLSYERTPRSLTYSRAI